MPIDTSYLRVHFAGQLLPVLNRYNVFLHASYFLLILSHPLTQRVSTVHENTASRLSPFNKVGRTLWKTTVAKNAVPWGKKKLIKQRHLINISSHQALVFYVKINDNSAYHLDRKCLSPICSYLPQLDCYFFKFRYNYFPLLQ